MEYSYVFAMMMTGLLLELIGGSAIIKQLQNRRLCLIDRVRHLSYAELKCPPLSPQKISSGHRKPSDIIHISIDLYSGGAHSSL